MKQCYQFTDDNEWYTFEKDVENFLNNVSIPKDKIIWCPFDTKNSAFVKVLDRYGYNVVFSHISTGDDFFLSEPLNYDIILSNPPFKGKANIIRRLKELNKPFALIFGVQCFNSGGFTRELKDIDNLEFILLCKRIKFHKGIENNNLPSPTFHSMWICNNIVGKSITVIE